MSEIDLGVIRRATVLVFEVNLGQFENHERVQGKVVRQ